jgi:hypothetical protein
VSTLICPKCRSSRVETNKGHDHSAAHGAHACHTAHRVFGAPPVLAIAIALGAWLVGKAQHHATHQWKCKACDHLF